MPIRSGLVVRQHMKSVSLQVLLILLVVVIAAGGLTLGFGTQIFRHGAPPTKAPIDGPAMSSAPISAAMAASSPAPIFNPAAPALPPAKRASAKDAPAFDIVRVEPDGDAVVAGRSAPGVPVELMRGDEVLGREVADQAGEFVIVPPRLPPGSYQLALRAKLPDGTEVRSARSVDVSIAQRQSSVEKVKPAVPSSIASAPVQKVAAPVLEPIEAGNDGQLTVRGRARPGSTIKAYLNDTFVASVAPGADQQFSVTINKGVGPGHYRVRLDQVDPASGTVLAHSEQQVDVSPATGAGATPVRVNAAAQDDKIKVGRPEVSGKPATSSVMGGSPSHVVIPKIETATVVRGDSLWRISRHSYGSGDLYSRIFKANRGKIHDPNLIYPSQIFVLPPR